jgi:hypothetical protein
MTAAIPKLAPASGADSRIQTPMTEATSVAVIRPECAELRAVSRSSTEPTDPRENQRPSALKLASVTTVSPNTTAVLTMFDHLS